MVAFEAVLGQLAREVGSVPDIGGVHHVALTVRDVSRSTAWYQRVLGLSGLFEGGDDNVSFVVLTDSSGQLMLGLRQYREGSGDRFDEFRTGLDHLAFAVSDKAELQAWDARFAELGVDRSPIKDSPAGQVLTLRDPDNIQLEFVAPPEG
jgi:glyoxylase I family protein